MAWKQISDAVVKRLPLYLRVLDEVATQEGLPAISSSELGERAGVGPALVRKDFAWFGEFGKQGVGYEVAYLRDELRRILHLDREIRVALVGVGSLGHALVRYHQAREAGQRGGVRIAAIFDNAPAKVGERVGSLQVEPVAALPETVSARNIQMGMVTVPAEHAQEVVDACVKVGIRAILNFAPVKLLVPAGVRVAHTDVSLELERLAYYLGEPQLENASVLEE